MDMQKAEIIFSLDGDKTNAAQHVLTMTHKPRAHKSQWEEAHWLDWTLILLLAEKEAQWDKKSCMSDCMGKYLCLIH